MEIEKCLAPIDCDVADCSGFARVAIRDPHGKNAQVCVGHIGERPRTRTQPSLRVWNSSIAPNAHDPGCRRDAVTRVDHDNGSLLPVCQRHLDDLSWLAMPNGPAERPPGVEP